MGKVKPVLKTENARFLKGHASWLYCNECNKTVAYLCYITYRYFHFSFTCSCDCHGWVKTVSAILICRICRPENWCAIPPTKDIAAPMMKRLYFHLFRKTCNRTPLQLSASNAIPSMKFPSILGRKAEILL